MDLTKFLLESLHLSKAKGAALIGHLLQEPMRDLPEGKQVHDAGVPARRHAVITATVARKLRLLRYTHFT